MGASPLTVWLLPIAQSPHVGRPRYVGARSSSLAAPSLRACRAPRLLDPSSFPCIAGLAPFVALSTIAAHATGGNSDARRAPEPRGACRAAHTAAPSKK